MVKYAPSLHHHYFAIVTVLIIGFVFGLVIYPKIAYPIDESELPSAPRGVVVTGGNESITLEWSEPESTGTSALTSYIVYISPSDDERNAQSFNVDTRTLSYVFERLENGTEYSIGVAAENSGGVGEFAGWYHVVPTADGDGVPDVPQSVEITTTNTSALVSFEPPRGDTEILSYKIYYSESEKIEFSAIELINDDTLSLPYEITNLNPNTDYLFYVTAVGTFGEGHSTELVSVKTAGEDETPPDEGSFEISETPIVTTTTNSATITWTTSKVASSIVYYGPLDTFNTSTPEFNKMSGVSNHSVTVTPLPACSKFWFKSASYDDAENYIESLGGEFTTKGCKGDSLIVASDIKRVDNTSGASLLAKVSGRGIEVAVPAGVRTDSELAIEALKLEKDKVAEEIASPGGKTWVGDHAYSLKAIEDEATEFHGTFDKVVTVSIDYSSDDLDGLNPSTLKIYHYEDGRGWMALTNCVNDYNSVTRSGTVTCDTTSFSVFGLFGENVSGGSGVTTSGKAPTSKVTLATEENQKPVIVTFTKNLVLGMTDPDVFLLQKFLNSRGFTVSSSGVGSTGLETNYFGEKTKKALIKFQETYKDSILTPVGLFHGTGNFADRTRAFVNALLTI